MKLAEAVAAMLETFDAEYVADASGSLGQEEYTTAAFFAFIRHERDLRAALAAEREGSA